MPLKPLIAGMSQSPAGSGGSPAVGSGAVLQTVVVAPKLDTGSGSNSAPTWAVGYSGAITPQRTTSRIIVACYPSIGGTLGYEVFARLERAGSPLVQADAAGDRVRSHVGVRTEGSDRTIVSCSLVASDAPASVVEQTYSLALAVESGGTWYINRSSGDTDANYVARTVSTMFLIEIA